MRVGLLQCDHVPDELATAARFDYPDMFARRFPDLDLHPVAVVDGEFPLRVDSYDAYLTTGSRYSVYDDLPWIRRLADFVRVVHHASVPFAGVCFGHQMLAHALGGRVGRSDRGWGVGIHSMQVVEERPWMHPPNPAPGLFMSCQDQITRLPPGATVLAVGETVEVAMMTVGTSAAGVAGHPEFTHRYAAPLYELRRSKVGSAVATAALDTMSDADDGRFVAGWLTQFLQNAG